MKDGLTADVSSTGIIRIRFNGRILYDLIGPSQPGTSELPTQPTLYYFGFSSIVTATGPVKKFKPLVFFFIGICVIESLI